MNDPGEISIICGVGTEDRLVETGFSMGASCFLGAAAGSAGFEGAGGASLAVRSSFFSTTFVGLFAKTGFSTDATCFAGASTGSAGLGGEGSGIPCAWRSSFFSIA
jgi:hypothetical protein